MQTTDESMIEREYLIQKSIRKPIEQLKVGLFVKCGGYSYKEFLARAMKIARAILFA